MRRDHVLASLRRTPFAAPHVDPEFPVDGVAVFSPAGLTYLPGSSGAPVPPPRNGNWAKTDKQAQLGRQVIGE
jgi:hypothetical protein